MDALSKLEEGVMRGQAQRAKLGAMCAYRTYLPIRTLHSSMATPPPSPPRLAPLLESRTGLELGLIVAADSLSTGPLN